ncbi:hypothetical protein Mgra_00004960 [Meloidogyne graminicola]|uniref:Uncharacterized protein n=1 Tax=Meloidogyne graminicola TaxID=189291 RepID=A0A8S9ZQX3_9BILA|nr:hypothetical protein Mgra_00004960 [Meloidogyne graminicola]
MKILFFIFFCLLLLFYSSSVELIKLSKRDLVLLGPGSCEKKCNQRFKGKEFTKCMKQLCGYP